MNEIKPKAFLLENVKNLRSHKGCFPFKLISLIPNKIN
ncbi:hypothetical protein HOB87_07020 [Candidatus Woesearchaeota archaeon]|nr:hypothetical protein [Candidatus Woesearchaeota archaeon]MBT7558613.1 hypothetical protein [Candidatus Woesearchaeota archaeon]